MEPNGVWGVHEGNSDVGTYREIELSEAKRPL